MTTPLSRRGFAHPAQGATGDATLYSNIEAIYGAIGDDSAFRWFTSAAVPNGGTVTLIHGLRMPFAELQFRFYTYTGSFSPTVTELTRQAQGASGVSVVANGVNPTTRVDITNNTGGTINIGTLISQMRYAEKLTDLLDVNITSVANRDRLAYDSGTSKWVNKGPYFIDDAVGWDGSATVVSYDVSALGVDSRKVLWGLKDVANNYLQIEADISNADSTHVTVTVGIPLAAGTYRLVGVY